MKVKHCMHKGATWVKPDTKIRAVAQIIQSEDIGAVPVGENDRLIGMITDRDIVCRAFANGEKPEKLTARDVMTKGITYCQENEEVEDAIRIMGAKKIRRLPVINKDKRMVGMLSIGDISHSLSHDLSGEVIRAVSGHHD